MDKVYIIKLMDKIINEIEKEDPWIREYENAIEITLLTLE